MKISAVRLTKYLSMLLASMIITACGTESENTAAVVKSHFERSLAYQQQGQYRAAIIEARNIIKKDSRNNSGYFRLSELYLDLGNYKAATEILENTPAADARSQLLLAKAYAAQRKYISTTRALEEYTFQGGEASDIQYRLLSSQVLAGKNQQAAARVKLQSILTDSPNYIEAQTLLTRLFISQKKFEQATALIEQSLTNSPENPEILYLASQLAYIKNDLPEAEKTLTRALIELPETDIMLPLRSRVLRQLSIVLGSQGRTSEALIYKKVLSEANPDGSAAQSQFNQALKALSEGNIEEAENILKDIHKSYPSNELVALYLGLIDYQQGDFDSASELLNSNIDVETASPQIIQTTAMSLLREQKTSEALKLLSNAIVAHKDEPKLLALYGLTALQSEEVQDKGVIAIERALAMSPDMLNLRLGLARYYLTKSNSDQAEAQLEEVLRNEPGHILATSLYVGILQNNSKKDHANKIISTMLKEKPSEPLAHNLAARYAQTLGDTNQAKNHFQHSFTLDPENTQTITGLAAIALQQRSYAEATGFYRQLITLTPTSPNAYRGLVTAMEADSKAAAAINTLEEYAQNLGDSQQTAAAVAAEYYLRKQQISKANSHIETALAGEKTPYIKNIAHKIAIASGQQAAAKKDWGAARKALHHAIGLTDTPIKAQIILAHVEIQSGNLPAASNLIEKLLTNHPDDTDPIIVKSILLDAQGDEKQATSLLMANWQESHQIAIGNVVYARIKNNSTKLSEFLTQWKVQSPKDAEPYIYSALQAQAATDNSLAIENYQRALALRPHNASALNNLAWLYFETSNPKAEETAKQAYELAPKNPAIMDTYGWILAQGGKKDVGVPILENALRLAPEAIRGEIATHLEKAKNKD